MISYIASYFAYLHEVQKVIREIPYGNFLIESRYKEEGDYYTCINIDTKEKLKDKVSSNLSNIYIAPKLGPDMFILDAYEGMLLNAPHDIRFQIVAPPLADIKPWNASLEWSTKNNAWIVK